VTNDPFKDKEGDYQIRNAAPHSLSKLKILTSKTRVDDLIRTARQDENDLGTWAIVRLGAIRDNAEVEAALVDILHTAPQSKHCSHYHEREAAADALRKLERRSSTRGTGSTRSRPLRRKGSRRPMLSSC